MVMVRGGKLRESGPSHHCRGPCCSLPILLLKVPPPEVPLLTPLCPLPPPWQGLLRQAPPSPA